MRQRFAAAAISTRHRNPRLSPLLQTVVGPLWLEVACLKGLSANCVGVAAHEHRDDHFGFDLKSLFERVTDTADDAFLVRADCALRQRCDLTCPPVTRSRAQQRTRNRSPLRSPA